MANRPIINQHGPLHRMKGPPILRVQPITNINNYWVLVPGGNTRYQMNGSVVTVTKTTNKTGGDTNLTLTGTVTVVRKTLKAVALAITGTVTIAASHIFGKIVSLSI